ncbi:hypothetical protein A0H81_04012 [Grifola frondosa]|uniref:Structure-specific endonuclease subunit SLX4 n=1 Tax=Grifola frondosa TaxID=5627 RepID=A0A1C7MI89_GRIFR|nr:hypothetical protein A0H81_04012 [Grifola frondosa]
MFVDTSQSKLVPLRLRKLEKERRRRIKRQKIAKLDENVIELTDSDGVSPTADVVRKPATSTAIVIGITGDSSGEDEKHLKQRVNDPPQGHSSINSTPHEIICIADTTDDSLPSVRQILNVHRDKSHPAVARATSRSSKNTNVNILKPTTSSRASPKSAAVESEDEDANRLDLGRFARSGSAASAGPPVRPAKKNASIASHRFTDFPTRIIQKMKHIQTCAKKNSMTDDTIRILLRKDLESLPPVNPSGKGKGKEEDPAVPETLLEDILRGGGKKKGRRPQVLQTVKSLTETRGSILDRARMLIRDDVGTEGPALGEKDTMPALDQMPSTQAFGESSLATRRIPAGETNRPMPPPTQAFAPKNSIPLTQPFGKSKLADTIPTLNMRAEALPSTQAFAPSKLALAGGAGGHDVYPLSDDSDSALALLHKRLRVLQRLDPSNEDARAPHWTSSPGSAHNLSSPQRGRRPSSKHSDAESASEQQTSDVQDYYQYEWNYDEWDPDNAYMTFVPEKIPGKSVTTPLGHSGVLNTAADMPKKRGRPRKLKGKEVASQDEAPSSPREPGKVRKPRKKKAAEQDEDVAGGPEVAEVELNAKLKDAILKDQELHLRVLRYEPVHFDVFLQLALDLGMPARSLRLKVRSFLDRQAIHFYGADLNKKNRTKKRRK